MKKFLVIPLLVSFVWDFCAPPGQQITSRAAIVAVKIYQGSYGLMLARLHLARCKFSPTCSNYAIGALRKYGTLKGIVLTAYRILRCSPFSSDQGLDPP